MIYLDALDGGDTVAGRENSWHYESKFAFEICRRLETAGDHGDEHVPPPSLVRGAHGWEPGTIPNRSHKKFIDIHCQANADLQPPFLPGNLGWWAFKPGKAPRVEPTHTDDIEYLCGKALANNYGLSLMGINPPTSTASQRCRVWRDRPQIRNLRPSQLLLRLCQREAAGSRRRVQACREATRPVGIPAVQYDKHRIETIDDGSNRWTVPIDFARQPLQLRIENADDGRRLRGSAEYRPDRLRRYRLVRRSRLPARHLGRVGRFIRRVKFGAASGRFTANNATDTAIRSWCKAGRTFSPPLDLTGHEALGLWVFGDGRGEVLNIQQTSPAHLSHAVADHYITIDFTAGVISRLVEPEGERHADYSWPYGGIYSIYRGIDPSEQRGDAQLLAEQHSAQGKRLPAF